MGTLGFPVFVMCSLWVFATIRVHCPTLVTCFGMQPWSEDEAAIVWTDVVLKLVFLAYPATVAQCFQTFLCREIEGTYYLKHDYGIECYDYEWAFYAFCSACGTLVYSIGSPALYFIVLKRFRHKLFNDRKQWERLGFIYDRYHVEWYFWVISCTFESLVFIPPDAGINRDAAQAAADYGGSTCRLW